MASNLPDGGNARVAREVVCAAMIDTGCRVGAAGGFDGGPDTGGSLGIGGRQGGRCMSWTCPIW